MNGQEIHGRPSSSFEGGVVGSHRDPLRILWISTVSYPISDLHANGIFDAFVDFREITVIQGVVVFQVSRKWCWEDRLLLLLRELVTCVCEGSYSPNQAYDHMTAKAMSKIPTSGLRVTDIIAPAASQLMYQICSSWGRRATSAGAIFSGTIKN